LYCFNTFSQNNISTTPNFKTLKQNKFLSSHIFWVFLKIDLTTKLLSWIQKN